MIASMYGKLRGSISALTAVFSSHVKGKPSRNAERCVEALAFVFVIVAAILVYIYALFVVVAEVFEGYDYFIYFTYVVGTLNLAAVLINLFLIRKRDSSIRNRMLLAPQVAIPTCELVNAESDDINVALRKRTNIIGQHFTAFPFGNADNWHMCGICEVMVPPRAWHCPKCNICILRRDHHCIFTMNCIGEQNYSNFLGFLFYLATGSTMSGGISLYYAVFHAQSSLATILVKALIPFFVFLYDFSPFGLFSGVSILGMAASWAILFYYIDIAFRGASSADNRTKVLLKTRSYQNFKLVLGPSPFLRLLWPFYPSSSSYHVSGNSNNPNK